MTLSPLTLQYASTIPTQLITWGPWPLSARKEAMHPLEPEDDGEHFLRLRLGGTFYFRPQDPCYIFVQPMVLDLDLTSPGKFVLSEPVSGVYGVGKNLGDAFDDLHSMVIDLFEELVASESELSQKLRQQLDYLRAIIQPR